MNAGRRLFPLALAVASILALSACFGYGGGPPQPLAVQFTTAPPSSDTLGTTFQVAAAVSNGSKVNWSCTPSGACGTFNPTQTASSAATTYTPPTMVPAGGSVTIMAVSAQDMTKSASANVTITAGGTISVTFNAPAPPPTLTTTGNATVSATITSTVTNAVSDGLDWTATCTNSAGGGCGTFTAAHTASGTSTTYNPPTTVPAGGVNVTVKAASTLDSQDNVAAVINVGTTQTSAFLCANCAYTYVLSGENAGGFYSLAGVLTTDGMGNITGGEQDYTAVSFTNRTFVTTGNTPDTLASGTTYSFGADGRGTITLSTGDSNIGANGNGVETLGVVFVSPTHLLITELDQSATASGTMDLQTASNFSTSTLSGGYTFVVGGTDFAGAPLGFGGVFNVDGAGTISGSGSVSDLNDGANGATQQSLNGSFTLTDAVVGRIQLTLRSGAFGSCNCGLSGPIIFDGYITDATHVKLVEVDSNIGVSSGLSVGQGTATGKLNGAAQLPANSSYVFTAFGSIPIGPVAFATTYTSDGSSKLQNGSSDVNADGVATSGTVTGNYSVDGSGTGRVVVNLMGNTVVGNPNTADRFVVYLTGGADPPMAMEVDAFGVTTGSMYRQATNSVALSTFNGPYGLNFTLFGFDSADQSFDIEVDISGQCLADGAGNLLGTLDINDSGSPMQNQAFTGMYASSANGRFTGSITSTATSTLGFSFFVVSPSQVVIIETDSQAVSLGLFQLQTPPF